MPTVKKVRKSAAPYSGAAAVWIAWAALRDLYRLGHFVFVAVLSLGVFLLLRAVCKDEMTETVVPDPPAEEEKPTGNAGLDKMIADGCRAVVGSGGFAHFFYGCHRGLLFFPCIKKYTAKWPSGQGTEGKNPDSFQNPAGRRRVADAVLLGKFPVFVQLYPFLCETIRSTKRRRFI